MLVDLFSFNVKLNLWTSKAIEIWVTIHSTFVAKLIMSTSKNTSKNNFNLLLWIKYINLFKEAAIDFVL